MIRQQSIPIAADSWGRSGQGNILFNDKKFVSLLYEEHEDCFQDMSKVTDAGKIAKDGIYAFLDIRLSVGMCKEFYQNKIDSFILASSDFDYRGLFPTLEEARFLVLVEEEKVSGPIRHTLEDAGITCCYMEETNRSR